MTDPVIIESPVWDIICRIAIAAEELSRTNEYIDAQGGCILRDARQLIGETVDQNLLKQMREGVTE